MNNNFCIGLDLGQSSDYTALAVVEKLEGNGTSSRDPGDRPGDRGALHLRHTTPQRSRQREGGLRDARPRFYYHYAQHLLSCSA
jgi:hypothetical protein